VLVKAVGAPFAFFSSAYICMARNGIRNGTPKPVARSTGDSSWTGKAAAGPIRPWQSPTVWLSLPKPPTEEPHMRLIISGLAAAALLAGLAASTGASAQENKKYRNTDRYDRYDRRDRDWRDDGLFGLFPGYGARNPDNFRTGSPDWWKAMDAEGRGGHPRL